jgi:hypothetical protein
MSEDEQKKLEIIDQNGVRIAAKLLIWEVDPQDDSKVKLLLTFGDKELESTSDNFFDALSAIRQELERDDLLLFCYGASRNVYPSPMILNMGVGEMAYKLTLGRKPRQEDLVSIFDIGADVVPVKVSEQVQFYEEWMRSLSKG